MTRIKVMFKRLRTKICGCCVFATALSLLYLFVMPTAFANGLLPCSLELFDLVDDMLKDTNGLISVDERLYTPSEADYETCPKSTLSCFAEEAKVLVYHNPALHEAQLTRRLISINTQEDSGNCLQCEVNNMEPVEKFLNTLKNIVQQINGHGCMGQP